MIRKLRFVLAATALAGTLPTSGWRDRKRIPLTPGDSLAVVKIDREVYFRARLDLADLRVLRQGEEIPYVLETLRDSVERREQIAGILDQSVDQDFGLQFTLRLAGHFKHNHVRIETDEHNFRRKVRIETSEDGKHWATVRADGAIFDFSQDQRRLSSLVVEYPVSTRRFLRVTIPGWQRIGVVTGAVVEYAEAQPASRETLAVLNPQVTEDVKTQTTVATLDAGTEGLPIDHIRVEVRSRSFHRAVGIETSTNGTDWDYLTQGVIARLPGAAFTEESLVLSIPETRRRYVRLRIYNRDDQPVTVGKVSLEGLVRRVKFLTASSGDYWLYYGNADAKAPVYDLPILLANRRERLTETAWTAEAQQPNPDYRPPPPPVKPLSERYPAILYTVLGAAVVGLGIATFRFAVRLRPPN